MTEQQTSPAQQRAACSAGTAVDPSRDQALILVVDDDATARVLARAALEQAGFAITEASDGVDGLERFTERRPDLVLLDVEMPGKNGFEMCAELRTRLQAHDVPVLMLTGLEDVDSINRAYEVGATDFVTKPINWTVLGHRLRYMLRASRAAADLRRSEAQLNEAQSIAGLGSWEWRVAPDRMNWSDETHSIFGIPPETRLGLQDFLRLVHGDDRATVHQVIDDALAAGGAIDFEYRIVNTAGDERVVHQQGAVTLDENGAKRVFGTVHDITERKRAEAQIRTLAYFDTLTGLPNRQMFRELVDSGLRAARRRGGLVAVLSLDLDGFKRINDSCGHPTGDMLLSAVADRLRDNVRANDELTRGEANVARLGGDEFTLMLTVLKQVDDVTSIARRILDSVALPFNIGGQELFVTASIGVAVYPYDGDEVDSLLKNAEMAMHRAKDDGHNAFKFYTQSMNARSVEQLHLVNRMRSALDRGEFFIQYQPQVNLSTGCVVGAEALLRWRSPEMGAISPTDFIPLAEETGLIVDIGSWVLRTACRQAMDWQEAGIQPITMSVNISGVQFRRGGLEDTVSAALDDSGLDARYLHLELTESVVMQSAERSVRVLQYFKDIGVSLAVDDFGTGYSSLSYLKRFPIDKLKIDRSFIKDVDSNGHDAAITAAIIAMGHSLNLKVIAEGVETSAQLAFIAEQGCDEIQGFLFAKPMSGEAFASLLRRQRIMPLDAPALIRAGGESV